MRKNAKRLLSAFLTLCLVMGFITSGVPRALAETDHDETKNTTELIGDARSDDEFPLSIGEIDSIESSDATFTISLDDFEIKYYDDSNDPSDYISRVTIDGEPITISMNHIASRSGIRLYQMDFDPDLQGSILAMNSDPWGIPVTYCGYALLFVALLWILIDPKGQFRNQLSELRGRRYQLLSVLLLFVYAFLLYHFLGKYSSANHPLPVLNSWLLPVHVSTIIMAYLLLFVAIFVRAMLYPALAFLGYGIFIGAIWANVSWGNYWSWDPKETWALITFMVYAVPAHKSFHLSNRSFRLYMALAFLTILMTYFGVNYLLGGMHSYA